MQKPNWGIHRIARMVDRAIERGDANWGKSLATLLDGQAKRLDAVFGKSPLRTPNLQKQQYTHTHMVICHIVNKHPDWTRETIAETVGYTLPTVNRHIRRLVDEGHTTPTNKPGRPRANGINGEAIKAQQF